MAGPTERIINGRYRLIRLLGEGGMGSVFLAADLAADGRPIALKRIHSSGLTSETVASFKSEFEAMTRLLHPNVVEVYEFGLDAETGEHFITLEYVQGENLRAATSGTDLDQRLDLLVQVCRGLDYIHARGLTHNDIKPQNILVSSATPRVCKLTDFGLVSGGDRTRRPGGGPRGTLQYLAPEVIHGSSPDIRSDIYALGVVFYLILAGRLPFDGEPSAILTAATTTAPSPPREMNPEIPAGVASVVMDMLEKDPARRPASAAEVIRRIGAANGRPYEIETEATLSSYVRSGTFVCRDEEVARLVGLLEAAGGGIQHAGRGQLAFVTGESGIGKTRLIGRIRQMAQLSGAAAVTGQCYEGSGSAFHPFRQILGMLPDAGSDDLVSAMLRDTPGGPGTGIQPRDAERDQRRLIDAAVQAIVAAAGARPLLVCIEDLQWADTASLRLLEHLARNAAAAPGLVVVASYRSEDAAAGPLDEAIPRLGRAGRWERIELGRMDHAGVAAMVSGMFGIESADPDLVDLLVRETEGNPCFVQVAVESLLDERALARLGERWEVDVAGLSRISFPSSIADAISRRIAHLDPDEVLVLEAMAVAEAPLRVETLARALGLAPSGCLTGGSLEGAIDALVRRHLLAREVDPEGALRLRVGHVRLRSHVYEAMDWGRRSELHGTLGAALEEESTAGLEVLAHHFLNSADITRALEYAERAGMRALDLCASDRAIAFLERALELVPPAQTARRLGIQLGLADAYRQGRDHARALETYDRLIKGARASGAKEIGWTATCHMLDVQMRSGRTDEAERGAERLARSLEAEGASGHLAFCLNILSSIEGGRGNLARSRELSLKALDLRREVGDTAGAAASLNNLGLIDMLDNPTDEGLALLQESLDLRRQLSDLQHAAEVLLNIGSWHRRRGDLAAAAARSEEAADVARRHRDRWLMAQCDANLSAIYHDQGRPDRASASARRAIALARSVGDEALACEAMDRLGMIQRDLGDFAGAEATHEEAVAAARAAGLAAQEGYALLSAALDIVASGGATRDPQARALRDLVRKGTRIVAGLSSHRLQSRLHEVICRVALAAGDRGHALAGAQASLAAATEGRLEDARAVAELLLAECHNLPGEGRDPAAAAAAARRAAGMADSRGLVETRWQARALLAAIEREAGRRSGERDEMAVAAHVLEQAAESIRDEQSRLAYLAEPRRAEVLRRASAIAAPRPHRAAGDEDGPARRALAAMYEMSGLISSMQDLDALLERILDVGLTIVGAERGLIILVDETTGEQRVRAARDLEDETVHDALAYSRSVVQEAAAGRVMVALDAPHDDRFRNFRSVSLYSIKSLMCVPMRVRDRVIGSVYVDSRRQGVPFSDQDLRFLEAFANLAASAMEQARLHERLASENVYLRREAGERNRYQNIIGKNVKMQAVYDLMEKVAASNLPVLIVGESGTGKELVARALHYGSRRRSRKFFTENVAAIPETLLESALFGHVRGAFTGADRDQKGLFEVADGGTLFLDEIGDMSLPMQSKVLRALQEGEIRPVGGKDVRRVDVRVISATNKDLERMMKEGRFREDLYYRLNVVRIAMPALRERKEDIPLLVDHFLSKIGRENAAAPKRIEVGALQMLLRYSWPGNVRELENEIQRLAVLCPGDVISQRDITESAELYEKITALDDPHAFTPLEEMERRQIEKALVEAAGNRGRAAELLGISRATIFRKLRKFGISH